MTRRLDAYLGATQLGITLASLGLGWLGEFAMASLIAPRLSGWLGEASAQGIAVTIGFAVLCGLHPPGPERGATPELG